MKWTFSDGTVYELSKTQEKAWKSIMKKMYKRDHGGMPHEAKSIRDHVRAFVKKEDRETGEPYWYEYGFLKGTNWTDEEAEEAISNRTYRVYSLYDCTGQPTTVWISWHRNPTGLISYVQCVTLDI